MRIESRRSSGGGQRRSIVAEALPVRRGYIPNIELARLAFWVVEGSSIQIVVVHVDARRFRIRNIDDKSKGNLTPNGLFAAWEVERIAAVEVRWAAWFPGGYIPTMRLCELRCPKGSEWEV